MKFILSLLFIVFFSSISVAETTRVPSGVVVTPQSFLRVAEGDLHLFVGKKQSAISPYVQQIASSGIRFSTLENGIRYQFQVQSAEISIPEATERIAAGIVSVTSVNMVQEKGEAVFWCAWQNAPNPVPNGTHGILLQKDENPSLVSVPHELVWNQKWTWFFENRGFVRQNKVVYWTDVVEGWERRTWVRRITLPYRSVSVSSQLGFSRFALELNSGQTAFLQIILPYLPVDLPLYNRMAAATHRAESKTTDPPESQRKTQ